MDESAFMEVQEPSREVTAHCWNKNIQDRTNWGQWKEQFHFICVTPPPRWHSSMPTDHGGKWECVIEHLISPALQYTTKKSPFILTPSRRLSHEVHNLGVDSCSGRTTGKAGNGTYQRNVDPTDCFVNSIRKTTHEPLGMPPLPVSQLAMGTSTLCTSHPNVPPICGCLCAQPWGQNDKCEPL